MFEFFLGLKDVLGLNDRDWWELLEVYEVVIRQKPSDTKASSNESSCRR
jgi:hypothetical protein